MDIKTLTDSEAKQSLPEPNSNLASPCGVRKKKSPDAGLVTRFRDGFREFIDTPLADHKVCLKTTMKNTIDKRDDDSVPGKKFQPRRR